MSEWSTTVAEPSEADGGSRGHWPHVACILDGSERSLAALARAACACGRGRLTVVLADRWWSLALAHAEWGVDMEALRDAGDAWVHEHLERLGITGAAVTVLDPPSLRTWAKRARPDLVVVVERRGLARLMWGTSTGGISRCDVRLLQVEVERRPSALARLAAALGGRTTGDRRTSRVGAH